MVSVTNHFIITVLPAERQTAFYFLLQLLKYCFSKKKSRYCLLIFLLEGSDTRKDREGPNDSESQLKSNKYNQIQRNTIVLVTFTATGVSLQYQQWIQSKTSQAFECVMLVESCIRQDKDATSR